MLSQFERLIDLAHNELEDGALGSAWYNLTVKLHKLTDSGQSIQEYYEACSHDETPFRETALDSIFSECGNTPAEQVIALILAGPGYPPRPLKREEAIYYVNDQDTTHSDDWQPDERCPICWAHFTEPSPEGVDYTIKETPCGHRFGHDCLVASLTENNDLCPTCQRILAL
ncbi:hypothetical protein CC86DRAFT_458912 [Ophiobolus disseminans]|uniref:RING-type domain-containing protein n=1 Tax=Ophiobolus disseminans TaxID=1469910 RepID=A0A6A6ZN52_9PLEO|nr:hypothetical protein CC86DRAFT_458912 [Ophiobolus disseminans]